LERFVAKSTKIDDTTKTSSESITKDHDL
jgi:hypothetical protein